MSVNTRVRKRSPCRSITLAIRRTSVMSEPRPRIMRRSCDRLGDCFGAAAIHRRAHGLDRSRKPGEHRLAYQEMADVELDNPSQAGNRLGARIIEPVPGMHFEAEAPRQLRALADAPPLFLGCRPVAIEQR